MGHLSVFLNTKIEDNGTLAAFGDAALHPVRYFFHGRTVSKLDVDFQYPQNNDVTYCDQSRSGRNFLRTPIMIAAFAPGFFIGVIAKGASYLLSKKVRISHKKAVHYFKPVAFHEINSLKKPLTVGKHYILHNVLFEKLNRLHSRHFKINTLVVYLKNPGEINEDPGFIDLGVKKLILVGGKIVNEKYDSEFGSNFDTQCAKSGKWLTRNSKTKIVRGTLDGKGGEKHTLAQTQLEQKEFNTVHEALNYKAPKRHWWSSKRYNVVCLVNPHQVGEDEEL